jgi:2-alkenal reductase
MKINNFKLWLIIFVLLMATISCSLPSIVLPSFSEATEEVVPTEKIEAQVPTAEVQVPQYIIPDEILLQDALVQLYENVSPGVVSIQVFTQAGQSGLGSGFVVDKEGHIVTNYHVVDGADEVEVHFPSGLKVYGDVLAVDLDSDLAVIKVDVDADQLVPLPIGDSDQVRVGQSVVAIGNPYGLTGTMTIGIVSARGRTLDSIRQTGAGTTFSAGDLIQTDATINPGNSGGPLLNLNGEVIGINRAIQTSGGFTTSVSNTGIGFAVSSNILSRVLPSLKQGQAYDYPFLGLTSLSGLSLTEVERLGLSQSTGAYILEVVPGGPADLAGLKAGTEPTEVIGLYKGGDLIIAADGQEILEFSELLSYLMLQKQPGDEIDLTVLRNGQEMTFTVTLGERPSSGQ